MKKKISTKKIVIIGVIVVIIGILAAVIAACGDRQTSENDAVLPVYTVYGIKGDTTTQEAIRKVELELNRVLTSRYNLALKLCLFNADEYEDALFNALTLMEMFSKSPDPYKTFDEATLKAMFDNSLTKEQIAKIKTDIFDVRAAEANVKSKDKGAAFKEKVKSGEYSLEAYNAMFKSMTENSIVETLEKNEDIYPSQPRVDIVLAPDFDFYQELTQYQLNGDKKENMLQSVASLYTSEARVLTQVINPTLRECSKIDKIPYGFPVNKPIGEYEFLVFDKQLLEKYGFDAQTMKYIGDLERFLKTVKENEPDVVPLMNSSIPSSFEYVYGDDTIAIANGSGALNIAFTDSLFINHFSVVARYRMFGYMDETAPANAKYAVRYVKGGISDLEKLEADLQQQYNDPDYKIEYTITNNPVATNDNSVEALFCFTKYCSSTDLSKAVDIVVEINKDESIKNTFLYGVKEEHYTFDENGYVIRLSNDYMMENMYTGNTFLAYTLQGGDKNYAERAMAQNRDVTISYTYGYKYEQGKIDGLKKITAAPDFLSAIKPVTDKYFEQFHNGTIIDIDYNKFLAESKDKIRYLIGEEVEKAFIEKIENEFIEKRIEAYRADAEYIESLKETVEKAVEENELAVIKQELYEKSYDSVKKELTEIYSRGTPEQFAIFSDEELFEAEIKKKIEETLTETVVKQELDDRIERGLIDLDASFEEQLTLALKKKATEELSDYRTSPDYFSAIGAVVPGKVVDETTGEVIAY
ncbi:MAG: hypothetical protein IJS94_07360, partial [Clostridia bacterium]|nr:hypothetical protein [Clostridia bacterium]